MEKKFSGYSVSVEIKTTPDGRTTYQKDVTYMPDEDSIITNHSDNLTPQEKLRDVSESELNEIMLELENEKGAPKIEDNYPLKHMRNSALR